eukprot:TRINITY_DN3138_c0_g1_i1.p1 TRINITY_DN3138_c0_g1~~TRINITY_DN3138_c0_g1_i1.p1  ORF type:complete len:259 (+),score=66.92 TRINITY_DN3138_c0_g1_i1:50-778(+)
MPRQQKEESIFDLIPPEPEVRIKPPRFDSSTIRNSATLTGTSMKSTQQKKAGTMGPAKVTVNAPNQFLKKHSKEPVLAEPKKFEYPDGKKLPSLPKNEDRPIHGLKSDKNFVKSNTVDAILMKSKKPASGMADYTKKKDYGKKPGYLNRVAGEIEEEYEYVRAMQAGEEAPPAVRTLSEEERTEMLAGLKENWEVTHNRYQVLSFSVDTPAQKARKEGLERKLAELEADIAKLSKKTVYISV